MSEMIRVTIPATHLKWLESVRETKGLDSIQDVVRDLITKAYEQNKAKSKGGN